MKVVLLALGSRGDVQPMVALGRELAVRGQPVTVVAMRDYGGLVTSAGLDFAPIERSMTESVLSAAGPSGRVSTNPIAFVRGASRWLAGIAPQVMAAELAAVEPDDLIVAGLLSIDDGAALREITGCRVMNVLFAPMLPTVAGNSSVLGPRHHTASSRINRMAGRIGVAAATTMCTSTGRVLRASRGLTRTSAGRFVRLVCDTPTLLAFSPVLVPPASDWPEHVCQTGAWLDPEPDSTWQPPAELAAFLAAGPPPVFISFGSVPGTDPDVDLIARGAALSGHRVVLGSVGPELPDLPPEVHVLTDAPYRWLLPRMAAVIHHGGAGTTTESLLAGVPNAAVSIGADQPFFGRRVHELGAGPSPVRRGALSAQRLAALINDLTGDAAPGYRAAANTVREQLLAERGVQIAADRLIEEIKS
ncbi:MAG TPA: glycosyltransferase [Pseudonocardiaceae bacterium]|nr:glycosyltransferase [Pseudonocardiaceae bacterium]